MLLPSIVTFEKNHIVLGPLFFSKGLSIIHSFIYSLSKETFIKNLLNAVPQMNGTGPLSSRGLDCSWGIRHINPFNQITESNDIGRDKVLG